MPTGYEVEDDSGNRAWWDGKKLTPLDARGYQMKSPPAPAQGQDHNIFRRQQDTVSAIDDAKKRTNWFRTGTVGGMSKEWPGFPSYNLDKDLDTLKARTAFEELAAMRRSSPSGGALGAISEGEMRLLQASEANLDVGQGEEQLDKNLDRMRRTATGRTQGLDASNPITLTTENQKSIPDGAYFRTPDGKVYRHKAGSGPPGGSKEPSGGFSDPAKEARYQAWLKANADGR